ncbi:MAG TPA: PaaI family thioesterase [Bellilinea sp.]
MSQKQPSARFCFVCGVENQHGLQLKFYDTAPGCVESNLIVPEHFQGFPGIAHGGVLASALDEAATRTILGANGSRRMVVTASLEVRFRKPCPLNTPLKLIGQVNEDKGEIILASSRIEDESGAILATAKAVLVEAPADLTRKIELQPEDWKVYPDGE